MYLTENKNFIDKLKGFLKQYDENPESSFRLMMKQMYIQDLMNYTRSHSNGKVVSAGYGNYNANIVLLLDSIDKMESGFFRSVIPNLDIPIHEIYITPYNKVENGDMKLLKNVAELEIKGIAPKCILSVGDHNIKIDGIDTIVIDRQKLQAMLELLGKTERTELDNTTLKQYKSEIWNQIKKIKDYY